MGHQLPPAAFQLCSQLVKQPLIKRLLIIGLGSIGQRHLRLARQLLPQVEIGVLHHKARAAIPEFADAIFADVQQALAFLPQIAVIANPATCHLAIANEMAKAGVHLLVEKPLAAGAAGVAELLEICRQHGVVVLTGYNLRFLRSLQKFRDFLMAGEIGRALSVRCEIGQYLPDWRHDMDYRQSVSARRELGGGALLELSHEIDYLCWIFGEVQWVKSSISRQSLLEIDVEDSAHLILGFQPAADGRQLIASLNIDFIRHDTTRLCTVIGDGGSLRWNGLTGAVEKYPAGGSTWCEIARSSHQRDDSYLAEWRHFLACVAGQEIPLISGEDGLRVLQIIDAARQAAPSGQQLVLTDK